jgi:hypothetical protein
MRLDEVRISDRGSCAPQGAVQRPQVVSDHPVGSSQRPYWSWGSGIWVTPGARVDAGPPHAARRITRLGFGDVVDDDLFPVVDEAKWASVLPFNDLSGECATSAQMYRWFVLHTLCQTRDSTTLSDCQVVLAG